MSEASAGVDPTVGLIEQRLAVMADPGTVVPGA